MFRRQQVPWLPATDQHLATAKSCKPVKLCGENTSGTWKSEEQGTTQTRPPSSHEAHNTSLEPADGIEAAIVIERYASCLLY